MGSLLCHWAVGTVGKQKAQKAMQSRGADTVPLRDKLHELLGSAQFYQGPHQWQRHFNATKEERFS